MTDLPSDAATVLPAIARAAIAERLDRAAPPLPDAPWLAHPGATFVTLTRHGRLRGCIGSLEGYRPLRADVAGNAVAAAFRDSRFPPLTAGEFDDTHIEVSVLSPPVRIEVASEQDARDQLRPGVDGIVLSWRGRRGTFLPQVWAQLPEPKSFLDQVKRKAGLPADWWSDDVELSRYTVTEFEER